MKKGPGETSDAAFTSSGGLPFTNDAHWAALKVAAIEPGSILVADVISPTETRMHWTHAREICPAAGYLRRSEARPATAETCAALGYAPRSEPPPIGIYAGCVGFVLVVGVFLGWCAGRGMRP